jgi:2-polyprenyl-6-methoxyphenol hydroxylase-like FAD-dependent oxidoreductase
MDKHDVDVLIVGAGPTGLTLACELARHWVSFRIIEKDAEPSRKSKALAVHSRSLEVFEDMGIVDRFLAIGLKLKGINVYADNKQIAHLTLDELDSYYSFALTLAQSETERLLSERLNELGGLIERCRELTAIAQQKNGVKATVSSEDGSFETINCRYLVGCDGAHSMVRKKLGVEFEGDRYPQLMHLGDVVVSGLPREDEIYVFNSQPGLVAFFPYGKGRYRVAASMTEGEPEVKEQAESGAVSIRNPTLEELQDAADRRCPYKVKLSDFDWSAALYIHCRHVTHYRVGNAFLAGDAAHIHSPAGGQGMNTGIQDSYNLAWKLGLVVKGVSSDTILDTYEHERLGIALGVLRMTDFMMKVNTLKNPVAKHLRNALAPVLTAQEVVQRRVKNEIAELSLNYRDSPIVSEHTSPVVQSLVKTGDMPDLIDCLQFKNGPEPGERAPDGFLIRSGSSSEGIESDRLFELLRGVRHVLLLFSGDETSKQEISTFKAFAQKMRTDYRDLVKTIIIVDSHESLLRCKSEIAESEDGVMVRQDFEMSCHHKYGAGANCLYLVRPDGYVGFRSQPIDLKQLQDYLAFIFDRLGVVASKQT